MAHTYIEPATSVEAYEDPSGTIRLYALSKNGYAVRLSASIGDPQSRLTMTTIAMDYVGAETEIDRYGFFDAQNWRTHIGPGALGNWYVYDRAHNPLVMSTDGRHDEPDATAARFIHEVERFTHRTLAGAFEPWSPDADAVIESTN